MLFWRRYHFFIFFQRPHPSEDEKADRAADTPLDTATPTDMDTATAAEPLQPATTSALPSEKVSFVFNAHIVQTVVKMLALNNLFVMTTLKHG